MKMMLVTHRNWVFGYDKLYIADVVIYNFSFGFFSFCKWKLLDEPFS